jgi:hypothetical protein
MRGTRTLLCFAAGLCVTWLGGCIPSTRTPERLYPVASEMDFVRSTQSDLIDRYYKATLSAEQMRLIRNEIIAQRMYAVDVQYTQYESALTREGQEVGFGATTAAEGLSTAATLVGPPGTKSILSGAATAVLATKGHYESEVLLAQTMRTIQKQMRASRNRIATSIAARTSQSVADYPLAAAMSDVEEYYNAGTLTTGVIDTSTTVGIEETNSKNLKEDVTQAPASQRASILRNAVITDATAPMPKPTRLSVLNPNGVNDFEQRLLLPARIAEMERVVCIKPTGKLTDALRAAVLSHLKRSNATAITNTDAERISVEFDAIRNGDKKDPCK